MKGLASCGIGVSLVQDGENLSSESQIASSVSLGRSLVVEGPGVVEM